MEVTEAFRTFPLFERLNARLDLRIQHAAYGRFQWRGRNRYPINRVFFILATAPGGGGMIVNHSDAEKQTLRLRAGYLYFMPLGLDLEFEFLKGLMIAAFHFNLELFGGYDAFSGERRCEEAFDDRELGRAFRNAARELDDLGAMASLKGIAWLAAGRFLKLDPAALARRLAVHDKYDVLLRHIREKADARTTIDELADVAACRRDTLSRSFSRDFGVPLKTYLDREIVRKAGDLLSRPNMKVGEASACLRFNNEYYFSRFFKKHTGVTPGRFRAGLYEPPPGGGSGVK